MPPRSSTDHLALVTADTERTVTFYTQVMGWPLIAAQRGERDGRAYLLTAFEGDGFVLEFQDVEGRDAPSQQVPGFPHIGLDVGTHDAYERWTSHLRSCGVDYLEVREDDCFFSDPNGLSFQLVVRGGSPRLAANTPEAAQQLVNRWVHERENSGEPA